MSKRRKIFERDGREYYADRPHDCSECFFCKNRKAGCVLGTENCYYLAGVVKSEQEKKCEDCPYAKGQPCVTASCYKDLGILLRRQREKAEETFDEKEGAVNA